MERQIQNTFNKIRMNKERKQEIRAELEGKEKRSHMWIGYVAGIAACITVLLGIPATRSAIVHAADYVRQMFYTAGGTEVVYENYGSESRFTIGHLDKEYAEVEGGRLYLVIGDEKIDVTDQCREDAYYRYEVTNDDGGRSILFVGGTVENPGWIELVFDAEGNYVFNQMKVTPDADGQAPAWVNRAMHAEGVPCGDPALDSEPDSEVDAFEP